MATTTMEKISEALKLVGAKKESLRQAFLELESNSSSLSSFSVSWPDLDSHFSSMEASLFLQFEDLKFRQSDKPIASTAQMTTQPRAALPESSARGKLRQVRGGSSGGNGTVRLEIKTLCEKMDGRGLRKYINNRHKELSSIKQELSEAFKFASDPALMVLDAMDGFYPVTEQKQKQKRKGDRDFNVMELRRTCVLLLEELMNYMGKEGLSENVKEKAKKLAFEWKEKVSRKGAHSLEALGFLTLVAAYDLGSEFDAGEIAKLFVEAARFREATNLCRMLDMSDKVPDIIEKLIEADKQLWAVKFICEFALAEKFPLVALLNAYLNEVKQSASNIRTKGNHSRQAMNEAASKEIDALTTVLKYIEDYKLESVYPSRLVKKRIKEIRTNINNKKRPAADMVNEKMQQQLKMQPNDQQPGSNRFQNTTFATPITVQTQVSNIPSSMIPYQPAHLPTAGLMLDKNTMYPGSSVRPYGLAYSSDHNVTPHTTSSTVAHMILNPDVSVSSGPSPNVGLYPGNRDSTIDYYGNSLVGVYSSSGTTVQPPLPSAYYSTATANGGGYNVPPQYHPQYYYPQ